MNLGNIKDHGTLVGGLEGSGGNEIIGLSDLMDEDVVMDGSHTSQAAAGSVMHSDSFNGKFGDLNGKSKEHCEFSYPEDLEAGKKDAQDFYNCIEEPLFSLPDDTLIWDILSLFELHLRLGFINNLVTNLNDKWSEITGESDPFWKFCDENGIKKSTYRGNEVPKHCYC